RLVAGTVRLPLLQLGDTRRRGLLGEAPGQEEVARIATGDRDDVAAQADVVDVREEDDLHLSGLPDRRDLPDRRGRAAPRRCARPSPRRRMAAAPSRAPA